MRQTVSVKAPISLLISGNAIQVFVGDDQAIPLSFDISDLVVQELLMYAIPASATDINKIDRLILSDDNIQKLRDTLMSCVDMIDTAMTKTATVAQPAKTRTVSSSDE